MFAGLLLGEKPTDHLLFKPCESDWIIHARLLSLLSGDCEDQRSTHFSLCICVCVYEGREWINVTISLSSHLHFKQEMIRWYINITTYGLIIILRVKLTGESIHLATRRLGGIEIMFLFPYSAGVYLIYNICLQLVNSSYSLHVDVIDFHNTRLCVILPYFQLSTFQK